MNNLNLNNIENNGLTVQALAEKWRAVGGNPDCFSKVIGPYLGPDRSHHTPRHLLECICAMESIPGAVPLERERVIAVFYHDLVMTFGSSPCGMDETESANAALRDVCDPVVFSNPGADANAVRGMIISTAEHAPHGFYASIPGFDPACKALLDADLWILCSTPARYARFEADIRSEYSMHSDRSFCLGRIGALSSLALRDPVYHNESETFDAKRALLNMAGAVETLKARLAAPSPTP